MGHFANGEWNSPCGVVFRRNLTGVGPAAGTASGTATQITNPDTDAEAAAPTAYTTQRQGLYEAFVFIEPTATNNSGTATVKGGVSFPNDAGSTVTIDLTDSVSWTATGGGTNMLTSRPFDVGAGKQITFYYTFASSSGANKNLNCYLMLRAC